VPADRHRHGLGHATTDHVADSRASQVVKQLVRNGDRLTKVVALNVEQPRPPARAPPSLANVNDRRAAAAEHEISDMRLAVVRFDQAGLLATARYVGQFTLDRYLARPSVLCFYTWESN
jgi:hypothetical protein